MKSKFIYVIIGLENLESNCRTKHLGWASKLEMAKTAVETNKYSMNEDKYNYVVIEETEEGIFGACREAWWYEWDGDAFQSIKKPEVIKNTSNFGIGN